MFMDFDVPYLPSKTEERKTISQVHGSGMERGEKTSRDLLILVQRFLFLWETKVGLMMPSLKMKVGTKLTFCTTVLDELN